MIGGVVNALFRRAVALNRHITRREAIKASGIAALGLAFSKPIIETIYPKPAFANYPGDGDGNGGGDSGGGVDTSSWIELSPFGDLPPSRNVSSGVYDPSTNSLVIFGGNAVGFSPGRADDTWILTHANGLGGTPTWIQLAPVGTIPPAQAFNEAFYDLANNRLVVIQRATISPFGIELWALDNANGLGGSPGWSQLSPTGGPPQGRVRPGLAYDQANNRVTMFGGQGSLLNDVWVLTNANGISSTPSWLQLFPSGTKPSPRDTHVARYDVGTNRMISFSGQDFSLLNDTWVLTHANGL